jgi:RNA polymerase sigma-70 factor (ECF subfamily)
MTVYALSIDLSSPGTRFPVAMSQGSSTESELVSRAQRGDLSAFEELFRSHQGRVYAVCLRMVADPGRADDLTQESFIRAWTKLGSFHGRSAFGTWLHRLAVNVVLGEMRSRKRHESRTTELEGTESTVPALPARDSVAGVDLEKAISGLPRQARSVFVLHDVEGYRHREIAELLGLAEGTCKAHLHRARMLLRKVLKR